MDIITSFLALDIVAIGMIIVGMFLLVLEIFLPGFGLPGISGLILTIAGIFFKSTSIIEGLLWTVGVIAVLAVVLSISLHSASKGRLRKTPLVLSNALSEEEGFRSTDDLEYFLGREGDALTVLRPAGIADFDGVKLDVVTEGGFIEARQRVKVLRVEGRRIVVRKAEV